MIDQIYESLLIDYSPFFANLLYQLDLKVDTTCDTAYTDGTSLGYNPEYVASLPLRQQCTLFAHEAAHCGLEHPYRLEGRDPDVANQAADHVINLLLLDSGFTPFKDWLCDPRFKGMDFEQVYSLLMQERQNGGNGGKPGDKGQPDPNGQPGAGSGGGCDQQGATCPTGEIRPAPQPGPDQPNPKTKEDWRVSVDQARLVAEKRGIMPGGMSAAVKATREAATDWRAILMRFVQQLAPVDISWSSLDYSMVHRGYRLPGEHKEGMPPVAVALDTSGSMWSPADQAMFARELTAILNFVRPERLDIIYCDTAVRGVASFVPGDQVEFKPLGGGGTRFQPVFDYIDLQADQPCCLIYLTDLEGPTPQEPIYPVLWATSARVRLSGPFGETVRVAN